MSDSRLELEELGVLLAEQANRRKYSRIDYAFPAEGQYARSHYPNHLKLFAAGKNFKERAFIAPNRVGKTYAASVELAFHATGLYPDWWEGHRFTKPVNAWAVGKTAKATKETIQEALLGPRNDEGTGTIPKHLLSPNPTTHPGIAGARQDIFVKHVSGGTSVIGLMAYDQGIDAFMGTTRDFIWLDEEPPMPIYTECLTRTATSAGLMLATFTPLNGISDVFLQFLPNMEVPPDNIVPPKEGQTKSYKWVIGEDWENRLPHLTSEQKERLLAGFAPWELTARTKGIPTIGSGAVYAIGEEDISCDPFEIPAYFKRVYGFDPGYKRTACVWLAIDPTTDTWYLYDEYVRGQVENAIHIAAIKARGAWIPGIVDTFANKGSTTDGENQYQQLLAEGLKLRFANKAVVAGTVAVMQRLSTGKLKIFKTCTQTLAEKRMYRYDEQGEIIKKNDDLMDALRYAVLTGAELAECYEDQKDEDEDAYQRAFSKRNPITGY